MQVHGTGFSSLPTDVLHHLCSLVINDGNTADVQPHVQGLKLDPKPRDVSNVLAFAALRSCCKQLKSACDAVQTSVSFQVWDQKNVEAHAKENTHLHKVSIWYGSSDRNVSSSLTSLHSVLPRVTSLKLHHTNPFDKEVRLGAVLGSSLLLWSKTLQHLELVNITCGSSFYIFGTCTGNLQCLSQLPDLKSLLLLNVSPRLTTEDIAGCTSLLKLTLEAERPCSSSSLDLSHNTLLQHVSCSGYSLTALNVTGLTSLQLLDCSDNDLANLDVSTCRALEEVSCGRNRLVELDVTMCGRLRVLLCSTNPLTSIQIHGCSLLEKLSCYRSNITELDLSCCAVLRELVCCSTGLTELDVSPAAATLVKLVCTWCPLHVLCHTGCTKLVTLHR